MSNPSLRSVISAERKSQRKCSLRVETKSSPHVDTVIQQCAAGNVAIHLRGRYPASRASVESSCSISPKPYVQGMKPFLLGAPRWVVARQYTNELGGFVVSAMATTRSAPWLFTAPPLKTGSVIGNSQYCLPACPVTHSGIAFRAFTTSWSEGMPFGGLPYCPG